jgi:glycine/D-amino acid oxidase-like deaminating enzyme
MTKTINVTSTPIETGPAGWKSILDDRYPSFNKLETDLETQWLVIGAGFAGIAAAQRLSQLVPEHERIVLLDACQLAEGPAGRNSGYMIDLPHDLNSHTYAGASDIDLKQIRLNRSAIEFAASMAEQYKMPQQVFSRSGKVTAAAGERGLKQIESYSSHLDELNESYTLYDSAKMKQYSGTNYYHQGLFTPGAVTIQPAAYIKHAAMGLSNRVDIYQETPVIALEQGKPHLVKTAKNTIKARKVILAVNGHIESFGYLKRHLLHVFTYASMTQALDKEQLSRLGGHPDWGVLPADPMGTTVRKISDFQGSGDRLTVRNHFTFNPSLAINNRDIASVAKLHDKAFSARFPMLEDASIEYRWGGRLCLSLNSVPVFGELDPGIYSAACQNGLGTVKGTLSGMLAAELAVLGDTEMVREFKAYDPPKKLPPEPFLSVGVKANLFFKEWLAGKEL